MEINDSPASEREFKQPSPEDMSAVNDTQSENEPNKAQDDKGAGQKQEKQDMQANLVSPQGDVQHDPSKD